MNNRFYPNDQTASDSENELLSQRIQETGTVRETSYIYRNKVSGLCFACDEYCGKLVTIAGQQDAAHDGNYHLSQGLSVERR